MTAAPYLAKLRGFVTSFADLLDSADQERSIIERGSVLLGDLVAQDDWLPDAYAVPDPARYQQYLLHRDSRARFSVVSFVWGPGQTTPIHDHRVWGLVGVLRGAERVETFRREAGGMVATGAPAILEAGHVDAVSPDIGDIHRVSNAHDDRVSVSIHVYGADIGAVERATFDAAGNPKTFVSGYADAAIPDIWNEGRPA